MSFRVALLVLTVEVAALGAAGDSSQSFEWWTTHCLDKVKPLDPVPSVKAKGADLYAGRNEFEPFQIVLRAKSRDLAQVDIDFSDLRTPEGAEISRKNLAAYFEGFMNLAVPSTADGAAGEWPDPLIPRVDQYAGEARNAFPFTVRRGRNQPLWVEVFVPLDARPGKYAGSARLSFGGRVEFSVPIALTVWRFALPSTATLRSSFGLNGVNLLKQHRGRYTNDDDLYTLTRRYAKAALLHRITINGGTMRFPRYSYRGGKIQVDWRDYDAEVEPFLNGTAIANGGALFGARATSAEIRMPPPFETEAMERLYLAEWSRHFQEKGWIDRLFFYLWDEPAPRDYPALLKRGRLAVEADPHLRKLVTVPFTTKLEDVVQIWVPLVNCLEAKPGFPGFCAETPGLDSYSRPSERGKSLWFYQSCASHGCNIIGGHYFTGWPSYMIDAAGPVNRVMQWVAWKYRMEGELYYSMDEGYGQTNDPWTSVRLFGGNGDGTLFYPGRPDRIGGLTDIPIESIRLKLIREGMEDYEYLALLAKLDGRKSADDYADRMVTKPWLQESRAEIFLKNRQSLGEAVDRAAARSDKPM